MRRVEQGMIVESHLTPLQVQYENLKTKQRGNLDKFQVMLLEKTDKLEQANIFNNQLSIVANMANTTLIICRDLCQEIATHATPIPTFYNLVQFLHMKNKLKPNV